MKKTYVYLILFLFFAAFAVSCSKDDDGETSGGDEVSLKINGVAISSLLNATCETSSMWGEGKILALSAAFKIAGDQVEFGIRLPYSSVSALTQGENLVDVVQVSRLYVLLGNDESGIGTSGGGSDRYYEVEGGKLIVANNPGSTLILNFKNFKISKEVGSDYREFTLNGSLTYKIQM